MSTVRLRRLQADYENLRQYVRSHPRLRLIQADGEPPERYQVELQLRSLREVDGDLKFVKKHTVEVLLPRNYPRTPPVCRMLTPIFHPNIAPHAVCIGDHWSAGEPLWSLVMRIGEMIAYQSYNTKSPLNGEAARWVDDHADDLPLDRVSLFPEEKQPAPAKRAPQTAARPKPSAKPTRPQATAPQQQASAGPRIRVVCPGCGTQYKVAANVGAKRVRCKKCQTVIEIPSGPTGA